MTKKKLEFPVFFLHLKVKKIVNVTKDNKDAKILSFEQVGWTNCGMERLL